MLDKAIIFAGVSMLGTEDAVSYQRHTDRTDFQSFYLVKYYFLEARETLALLL